MWINIYIYINCLEISVPDRLTTKSFVSFMRMCPPYRVHSFLFWVTFVASSVRCFSRSK